MIDRRAALAAGTLVLLALHAVLVWPAHGFLLSDTTGYLANARWLVGKAGHTWQGPSSFYNPGWSLLAAPLYVAFHAPRHVQLGVLTLNAALATAVLPAAYALGRRAFLLPRPVALAGAVVAATYPAVLLLAGYEWGESLYQLLFVLFVLAVATVTTRPTMTAAAAVGGLGAALNAVHPRGLGVVAVAGVFLVVLGARGRLRPAPLAAGLVTLAVAFLATRLLSHALLDAIYSSRSAAVEGDVLHRVTDPHLVWGAAKATLVQLWYLSVASFGLVPLGALWLATTRHVPRCTSVTTLAAALATLAASALEMSDGTRVDHMVYGRYLEGVVPVLLVAGAGAFAAWRSLLPRLGAGLVALTAGAAALLVLVRGGNLFTGDVMPLNVTGILVYRHHVDQLDVARVTILALALALVVFAVARWRTVAGLALVAALFAGSAGSVEARTLRPFDDFWSSVTEIPATVRAVSDRGAVSYDKAAYDVEAADFYQLELSDRGVRFFDSAVGQRSPTDLVISSPRWPAGERAGARLVFSETGSPHHQALWVMPGRLQEHLARVGDLVPAETSAPLPDEARRQRIEVGAPTQAKAGAHRTVDVRVRHEGAGAAWLPVGALPAVVDGTVRLGARWYDADGKEVSGQTAELGRVLLPGQSTAVALTLVAPASAGRYRLTIGLRQEGVAWFDHPATFTVDVRP